MEKMGQHYCRVNKNHISFFSFIWLCRDMIKDIVKHRAVVHYKHFMRSLRKVAKLYEVSKSSLQRWATSAGVIPKQTKCKRKLTCQIAQIVKSVIADNPFVTMKQLADKLTQDTGLRHSRQCASRFTKDLRYSKKKVYKGVAHQHDQNKIRSFCDEYLTAVNKSKEC
jgi:transposase